MDSITGDTGEIPGTSRAARRLNAVLRRCLALEPADRIASAAELRKVLVPAIRAYPPPVPDSVS